MDVEKFTNNEYSECDACTYVLAEPRFRNRRNVHSLNVGLNARAKRRINTFGESPCLGISKEFAHDNAALGR